MSRLAVAALLACLLLAGCGGPLGESTTTDAETTANATRAIAAPVSETGANGTTEATSDPTAGATATSATSAEQTAVEETAGEIEAASASGGTDAGGDAAEVTTRTSPSETANGTATNQTTTEETYERNMPYEVRVSNTGTTHRNITVRVTAANDSIAAFEVSARFAPNETREFDFTVTAPGEYEARVEVEGTVTTKRWDIGARDPERALSVHVSSDGRVYVGFLDI